MIGIGYRDSALRRDVANRTASHIRVSILPADIGAGWTATALINDTVRSRWCATKGDARATVTAWLAEVAR